MSNSDDKKEYSSISLTRMDLNLNNKDKKIAGEGVTWVDRKAQKMRKAAHETWLVGKQGFLFGCLVGSCLGLVFGGYESIRSRSIWPLPLAMIGSGATFACIFGISTVIRVEKNTEKEFSFEVLIFDEKTNSFNTKKLNYLQKVPSKLELTI